MFRWPHSARLHVCGAIALATLPAAPAVAQELVPIAQARTVSGLANASQCSTQFQGKKEKAAGFEPFNATVELKHACNLGSAATTAIQHSEIGGTELSGSGSAHSLAWSSPLVPGAIHAIGGSSFDVTFNLLAPQEFQLTATLTAAAAAGNPAIMPPVSRLQLIGPGGQTLALHLVYPLEGGGKNTVGIRESVTLEAGIHQLLVSASAIIDTSIPPTFEREATFEFAFSLPACLGDINGDGKTCQEDLGELLAAFGTCEGQPGYNPKANLAKGPSPLCPGGPAEGIDQADLGALLADYGCGGCP